MQFPHLQTTKIQSQDSHLWQVLPDEQSCQLKGGSSSGHYTQAMWANTRYVGSSIAIQESPKEFLEINISTV